MNTHCPLCHEDGGEVVWRNHLARVVLAHEPDYPGFCRVILAKHQAEMTDLPLAEREALMAIVWAVEAAVRQTLNPDKINLASLGNMVPHVHWHVIPRWQDDLHFPAPIWAAKPADRTRHQPAAADLAALRQALEQLAP